MPDLSWSWSCGSPWDFLALMLEFYPGLDHIMIRYLNECGRRKSYTQYLFKYTDVSTWKSSSRYIWIKHIKLVAQILVHMYTQKAVWINRLICHAPLSCVAAPDDLSVLVYIQFATITVANLPLKILNRVWNSGSLRSDAGRQRQASYF